MLSVVLDATPLAGAESCRGVGTYVRELAGALGSTGALDVRALDPGVALPPNVTSIPVRRRAPGRFRPAEHALRLPRDLRRAGADVVHSTGIEPPRRSPTPLVQTLFDVIPLVSSDPALASVRRRWSRFGPRYRDADAIIAISRHAADEGMRTLGLDARRITVAHLGVSPDFVPEGAVADTVEPYLLVVGEHSERKGFAEAFQVIGALADAGYPHHLQVAGRIAPWVRSPLEALRRGAPRPDRVHLLDWVDDLPALYRGATAVVVTSRYEGFGLPAVEAMACGRPVVAFDNTATGEVVAGGGVLVPDGDVAAFVGAVRALLDHDGHRSEVGAQGLARAQCFQWSTCADIHRDVYHEVAGR